MLKPTYVHYSMYNTHVPQLVRLGKCRNQRCVLALVAKGSFAFWTLNAKFTSETNANVSIPHMAVRLDTTALMFAFARNANISAVKFIKYYIKVNN